MPTPQSPNALRKAVPFLGARSVKMPVIMREARALPDTYNADKRTVDVTFTTGSRVLRYSWVLDGYYYEELSMDPKAIRMDRLQNGKAPVLDTHSAYSLSSQIGVVDSADIENDGKGRATLRFSSRPELAGIVQDIQDGIICNVSIGYRIHELTLVEQSADDYPVYRATDWEPNEISMVPIPADAEAGTRDAGNNENYPCQIRSSGATNKTTKGEKTMDEAEKARLAELEADKAREAEAAAKKKREDEEANRAAAAVEAERTRASEITMLCEKHGMPSEFRADAISKGTKIEDVRSAILEKLASGTESTSTRSQTRVNGVGEEQREKRAEAMTNALLHRHSPIVFKAEGQARDFVGMTLQDMARDFLENVVGMNTRGMSRERIAKEALCYNSMRAGGSHTTSDFANILANVANKTLRAKYDVAPKTYEPFTRIVTATDYKLISRMQIGEAPKLLPVNEAGEYEYGTIRDGKETYQVSKYGRIIKVTDEVIINDDMDALTRLPEAFGDAAAILLNAMVWSQIINNPTMGDGIALFHANHNNLITGAGSVLSSSDLGALNQMREKMRMQVGLDGVTPLNLSLGMIAVPASLETVGEQITTPINATVSGNTNPYANRLKMIVEPLLGTITNGDKMWYGFANGGIDKVELAFLEGTGQGPVIETRHGWEVDGVEIKCKVVAGAKTIDYRGLARSNGQ